MTFKESLKASSFSFLKRLNIRSIKVSRGLLLRSSTLVVILLIALIIRLLPARWGFYINEFDPYYQYRVTKHITENGFFSFTNWRDYMSWYPWGRNIASTTFPGVPFTAAALYMILNFLGIPIFSASNLNPLLSDPLYNLCVIFDYVGEIRFATGLLEVSFSEA